MRPRIGITSWHHEEGGERWEYVPEPYSRATAQAGGLPLILPTIHVGAAFKPAPTLDELLDAVDGLLFTGGEDIHPSFYGEPIEERCGRIDQDRDHFELELAQAALDRQIPIVGICRGIQLLNVVLGGSLYQDLSYRPGTLPYHHSSREKRYTLIHKVNLQPESHLAKVFGRSAFDVTSTHHQLLKDVAPPLKAVAFSDDGVVEGVEAENYPFLLAVQWHPERMIRKHPEQLALFQALIQAASSRRERRGPSGSY
ncbi:MAG: gamma-glutamyl-gamma-aminobutyrate hydrolase family protein [candidate division NC10 bacterium]|nr:gamma-glutamyl-gamma-aminobutyrate hydrolase family protein [candidate division NC10 bacterium]